MFAWIKSHLKTTRPSKDETDAERVLDLLARALKEVHPSRFIDPLEAALVAQPRLVLLNRILDKPDHSRFAAVKFNDLIERVSSLEQAGLIGKIGTLTADDAVLLSLILAAMHERHNPVKRDEVRQQAELLLRCLGGK